MVIMAKRIISDATYTSKKVRSINPPELRPEYLWVIPIADDNGVFEYDPERIWAEAYSLSRPGWDETRVNSLLEELVRVGLVEKYEHEGKTYGCFTKAVLPPPTRRFSSLPLPPSSATPRDGSGPYQSATPELGIGSGTATGSASGSVKDYEPELVSGNNGESQSLAAAPDRKNRTDQEPKPSPQELRDVLKDLFFPLSGPRGDHVLLEDIIEAHNPSLAEFRAYVDWAINKSNFWPDVLTSIDSLVRNFKKIRAQYEAYYKNKPNGRKPHQLDDTSKSFMVEEEIS